MLIERLIVLLIIAVVGAAFYAAWRLWSAQRLRRLATDDVPALVRVVVGQAPGPAILYFTSEDCTQCRYRQWPILAQVGTGDSVAVHAVDAPSRPDLVRHFGIMTVPSTVVLAADLRPVAVNHGLATLSQLQQQIHHAPAHP